MRLLGCTNKLSRGDFAPAGCCLASSAALRRCRGNLESSLTDANTNKTDEESCRAVVDVEIYYY